MATTNREDFLCTPNVESTTDLIAQAMYDEHNDPRHIVASDSDTDYSYTKPRWLYVTALDPLTGGVAFDETVVDDSDEATGYNYEYIDAHTFERLNAGHPLLYSDGSPVSRRDLQVYRDTVEPILRMTAPQSIPRFRLKTILMDLLSEAKPSDWVVDGLPATEMGPNCLPVYLDAYTPVNFINEGVLRWSDTWIKNVEWTLDSKGKGSSSILSLGGPGIYRIKIIMHARNMMRNTRFKLILSPDPPGPNATTQTLADVRFTAKYYGEVRITTQTPSQISCVNTELGSKAEADFTLQMSRSEYAYDPMGGLILGYDTPIWITDHRQHVTKTLITNIMRGAGLVSSPHSRWVRDLTAEGIEPNPGPKRTGSSKSRLHTPTRIYRSQVYQYPTCAGYPSLGVTVEQYYDHFGAMAERNYGYHALAHLLVWNRFDALGTPDVNFDDTVHEDLIEILTSDEDCDKHGTPTHHIRRKRSKSNDDITPDDQRVNAQLASSQPPRAETQHELNERRGRVIQRIANKLSRYSIGEVAVWCKGKQLSRKMLTLLATCLWGEQWHTKERLTLDQLWIYAEVNCMSKSEFAYTAILADPKISQYEPVITDIMEDILQEAGFDASAARMHNKQMHSLNGNIFSSSMKDIDEAKSVTSFFRGTFGPKLYHPRDHELLFNVHPESQVAWSSTIRDQSVIIGTYTGVAGAHDQGNVIDMPVTPLQPLKFCGRTDHSALYMQKHGYPLSTAAIAEFLNCPLVATALSTDLTAFLRNSATNKFRTTDTQLDGFKNMDIGTLNSGINWKGLSMELPILKLALLSSVTAFRNGRHYIPDTYFKAFDPYYNPEGEEQITITINDDNYYDHSLPPHPDFENRRWNNMPFSNGAGTIAFHVCLETVPGERKANAIFIPRVLLNACGDESLAIALVVAMFCEWPYLMPTIHHRSSVSNVSNSFLPFASLIYLPGLKTIDVVLPRRQAATDPTTQASANQFPVVLPMTGDTAIGGLNAHQPYDICFLSADPAVNGLREHNLVLFLWSHFTRMMPMMIRNMYTALASTMGLNSTCQFALDFISSFAYRYPLLTNISGTDSNGLFYQYEPDDDPTDPINQKTEFVRKQVLLSARPDHITGQWVTANFDYSTDSKGDITKNTTVFPYTGKKIPSVMIYEPNISAFNKVILGLATAQNLVPEALMTLPADYGELKFAQWAGIRSMAIALAWEVFYAAYGWGASTWNTAATNAFSQRLQDRFWAVFVRYQNIASYRPPAAEKSLRAIFENIFKSGLVVAPTKSATDTSPGSVTIFGRIMASDTFAGTLSQWRSKDQKERDQLTVSFFMSPTLLVDVWKHYISYDLPKFMRSFPPSMGLSSTQGYITGAKGPLAPIVLRDRHRFLPYLDPGETVTISSNSLPLPSDESRFNERIMATEDGSSWAILTGSGPSDADFIEDFPFQRNPSYNGSHPYPDVAMRDHTAGKSTTCMPIMNASLERITVRTDAQNARQLYMAYHRTSSVQREAWMLEGVTQPELIPTRLVNDIDPWAQFDVEDFGGVASVEERTSAPSVRLTGQMSDQQLVAKIMESKEAEANVPPDEGLDVPSVA